MKYTSTTDAAVRTILAALTRIVEDKGTTSDEKLTILTGLRGACMLAQSEAKIKASGDRTLDEKRD